MDFSQPFYSLSKFTAGLNNPRPTAGETAQAADYLGLALSANTLDETIEDVTRELSRQNSFLSQHLSDDSIVSSGLHRSSLFVREVVANNRRNRSSQA